MAIKLKEIFTPEQKSLFGIIRNMPVWLSDDQYLSVGICNDCRGNAPQKDPLRPVESSASDHDKVYLFIFRSIGNGSRGRGLPPYYFAFCRSSSFGLCLVY